jgi:hypothetical protein
MIKLFPKPLLAVLTVFFVVVMGSCKKDSDDNTTDVTQLLSFGPTGANHGDTIKFIGTGLDKVTAIQFTGNNAIVEQSGFVSQSPTLILTRVPASAEKGKVMLKTPQGDIVSKTEFNIGVTPVIASITEEARPGANLTLTGEFMNWVTSVTFARDKVVTEFVSVSLNELVVKVPEDAETGPLVITYSGTDSGYFETVEIFKVTLPQGTGISPDLLYHGENVTITGTDLDLVRKVYFTNVSEPVTEFESQDATELVVKVPTTALKGVIKLEAASGVQTTVDGELDIKLPQATGIAPANVKHLENITITGTDLDLVSKIWFTNATEAVTTFVSQSATQIVVQVPGAAKNGPITLEMESGIKTTSTAEVTLLLPQITSFSPNPVDPESNLTISGTNLDLVSAVVIENVPAIDKANFVSHTANQIVVTVPTGAANGLITLKVLNSTVTVLSTDILQITGAAPPPAISLHFWDDGLAAGWNGWSGGGWGGTKDIDNSSPVRVGTKSVKITYDASQWGSPLQLGGANISLAGYSSFKISIYSTAGTAGNKILIVFNKNEAGGGQVELTLGPEGEWTDFSIPLSQFGSVTTLNELWIKENQGKSYTIYVDEIGLN